MAFCASEAHVYALAPGQGDSVDDPVFETYEPCQSPAGPRLKTKHGDGLLVLSGKAFLKMRQASIPTMFKSKIKPGKCK